MKLSALLTGMVFEVLHWQPLTPSEQAAHFMCANERSPSVIDTSTAAVSVSSLNNAMRNSISRVQASSSNCPQTFLTWWKM